MFGLHIGAAAVEAAYSDLESVLKELQALHKQADAAHEQATSNTASSAGSNSFRCQQEHNAAIEKIQAVLPFLEAELLDAAHDDPSRLIVPVVMLPLIQKRLSDEAAQHAERTAQKAFDDLLQDEVRIDHISLAFTLEKAPFPQVQLLTLFRFSQHVMVRSFVGRSHAAILHFDPCSWLNSVAHYTHRLPPVLCSHG